jgi:DNA polymerase-3 subunit alpha
MLARGETMGLFQLSGSGMTSFLKQLKPTTIHDINAMVALYRPGPMEMIPTYIERNQNPSLVTYLDPRLKKILELSYGVITYQDDVMMTAIELAGFSWLEADKLRKAMGKKIPELMEEQKKKLFKGFLEHGLTQKKADDLWHLIEPFAAYGFNKAHAASYGRVAYQTAYMKANYPVEYMSAVLTADSGDTDKISETIHECVRMGIVVLPPDINESFADFTVVPDQNTIRFGLTTIKNFGEGITDAIIKERKAGGPFASMQDFLSRIHDRNLNKNLWRHSFVQVLLITLVSEGSFTVT